MYRKTLERFGLAIAVVITTLASTMSSAPAATLDLTTATVADVQAAYAGGQVSAEQVVSAYLARIAAYDKQGPRIEAIVVVNPAALDDARALDRARAAGAVRGPLHGIPVVIKDNIDVAGLGTTAGSQLLEGNVATVDAPVVARLRRAGAIILAKVNMSEFAGSGGSVSGTPDPALLKAGAVPNGSSSLGLQTRNPHDPARGPHGSSGGTGAALAAVFAPVGLGTDTGGSVRMPASANGIVGFKPTNGLLSRTGVVPLALTFDTVGPMARSVTDAAIALGVMTGVDAKDASTAGSAGKFATDYTPYLKRGSLKGARIGIARALMGKSTDTDAVVEQAIAALRSLGAEVVDPAVVPEYLIDVKSQVYNMLVAAEFKAQLTDYLKTLGPGFPRGFDELVTKANDPATKYRAPGKAVGLKYQAGQAMALDDPQYLALKNVQLPAIAAGIEAVFVKYRLDALVYPTMMRPAPLIDPTEPPKVGGSSDLPTIFANEAGLPDLAVPAGMTNDGLPVTISFLGRAWSEGQLLGYGYDFEQETKALRLPKFTPALTSDVIAY